MRLKKVFAGALAAAMLVSIIGKTITQITFYAADGVYVLPVNVAL